jgi:hypothetical protein
MPNDPGAQSGFPFTAILTTFGQTLTHEIRRFVSALLLRVAIIILLLVTGIVLSVVGMLRLGDALALACAKWLGDPILGNALSGAVLIMIPLAVMWIMLRRLKR